MKLQTKRVFHILPLVLITSLILFLVIALIFNSVITNERDKTTSFKIGITGDTEAEYFKLGMSALKTFDSAMFTMEIVEMDEDVAKKALEKGEISAYAIIPKDFIEKALVGDIETVKYVTTAGSNGLVSIFKTELTKVITILVAESQKGVYGIEKALDENGHENLSYKKMNQLNIKYIDLILNRSKLYSLETLDISNGLTLPQYYLGCLIIIFLLFQCLPFATIYVKKDYSLNKLLSSKCFAPSSQIACEYFTFAFSILILSLVISAFVIGGAVILNFVSFKSLISLNLVTFIIALIAVICLITSISLLLFELSHDLITGVLIQFFVGIFMCYVSGCIFPIYSMPKILQTVSPYLPIGIARNMFENAISNNSLTTNVISMCAYIFIFYLLTVLVRKYKLTNTPGW